MISKRAMLEYGGKAKVAKLIRANSDRIGDATSVCRRFGITAVMLERDRDAGRVIAFRCDETDYLYPFDQFEKGRPCSWAAEVIDALGNGAPAIHFLYVPRLDLVGRSIAEIVSNGAAGTLYLRAALKSLATE